MGCGPYSLCHTPSNAHSPSQAPRPRVLVAPSASDAPRRRPRPALAEVFCKLPYNEKADVFSFAVLMYELLSRELLIIAYFNSHKGTKLGLSKPEDYASKVRGAAMRTGVIDPRGQDR